MRKLLPVLVCLVLVFSTPVSSAASYNRTNLFLEMMRVMLEMMGMIDRDNDYYNMPYPVYGNVFPGSQGFAGNPMQNWLQLQAMQQMLGSNPAAFGLMPGMTPGMNPFMTPGMNPGLWSGPGLPGLGNNQTVIPFLPDYLGQGKKTGKHWIEGKWQANDGMIMEVHRGYFKMYYRNSPREVRGGMIRIKDRWLAIFEKSRNFARTYEFGYKDKRLVLRDDDGNIMLFRRLTDWSVPLR
jgi:hypothetical protein